MDWRVKSKCSRLTPQESDKLFFSQGRTSKKAKAFCKDCPVIQECLAESLREYNRGFWGGKPECDRTSMRVVEGTVVTAGVVTFS